MSVETFVPETDRSATASPASVQQWSTMSQTRLGPPFFAPWGTYTLPEPNGFSCKSYFSPHNGGLWAEMWAEPHPPSAPLTIGWCSLGYKRLRFRAYQPGVFFALVRPTKIQVVHNGGVWVPKAAISLHQGKTLIAEDIRNLYLGSTTLVRVYAPRAGYYDLSVGAAIRSVYKGSGNPYGMLDAQIDAVFYQPRFQVQEWEEDGKVQGQDAGQMILPVEADAEEVAALHTRIADAEFQEVGAVESIRQDRD